MGTENGAVATNQEPKFKTQLSVVMENHMDVIKRQMLEGGAEFDSYSAKCVMSAMCAINNMIHGQGLSFKDLNQSNITEILLQVATLNLNANAVPRECYFQVRNVNVGGKGNDAVWEKQIEFGIEGDGNDAILAKFGRDIKKVHQVWLVRSGDRFAYPRYNGLEMTAPQWEPTGHGEVIRVVYPIVKTDNTVEYYIGERRDVVKNLYAHISNNLMNETFGIVENRYKAKPEQKQQIAAKKKEILEKAKAMNDLDKILDSEELAPYISPAWREYQSREQMIIRKMRNNVVKKIPKDFRSAIAAEQYNLMDDTYKEVHAEINAEANSVVFDAEYKEAQEKAQIENKEEVQAPSEQPPEEVKEEPKESEPEKSGQMEIPDWMNPQ